MLSEINGSCAAVRAHSVIVCDCIDTPCWAEDITTTWRARSLPVTMSHIQSHFQPSYHTEVNETLKSSLYLPLDLYYYSKEQTQI